MYELRYARRTRRDLRKIDRQHRVRIKKAIESLSEDPRKKSRYLRRHPLCDYCLRIGDYRVFFDLDDERKIVKILKVGHRRDVYRY